MSKLNLSLLSGSLALFAVAGYLMLQSPPEEYMGHTQKIMYVHLPAVFLAYILFFGTFMSSWGYLWKRQESYDIHGYVCTEIATLYTFITLATGSIWGRPTWNTYWTWDAKLTITLILFLIFCGYLLARKLVEPGERQARLCAVLGILGFMSVPLNHMSVRWWRSIHQSSTLFTEKDTLSDEYKQILYIAFLAFSLLTIYIYRRRLNMERQSRQSQQAADELLHE